MNAKVAAIQSGGYFSFLSQSYLGFLGNWTQVSNTIVTAANTAQQANALQQQQQQATPQTYSFASLPFYVGRARILSDQLRAASSTNSPAVMAAMYAALRSVPVLKAVWGLQVCCLLLFFLVVFVLLLLLFRFVSLWFALLAFSLRPFLSISHRLSVLLCLSVSVSQSYCFRWSGNPVYPRLVAAVW